MGRPAKVQISATLDPRSVDLMDDYARELHLSRSAFIDLMVTQIDQVLRVVNPQAIGEDEGAKKEGDAGRSAGD